MKKFIKEFKEFAMRGNVIDMAVGIIIGTAFSKIVSSLVDDIIMPVMSKILGGIDLSYLHICLQKEKYDPITSELLQEGIYVEIGQFISAIIDFIFIAFAIFVIIKLANEANKLFIKSKIDEAKEEKKNLTQEELLTQILEELKKK